MNRSRTALALALAGPLLALGACSEDPRPKMAPSRSTSPTASTPEPSSSPTSETAEDSVRTWVAAQNLALKTGDVQALRRASAKPCQPCDQFIDPIQQVYQDGGYFKTSGWRVASAETRHGRMRTFRVDTKMIISGGKTRDSRSAKTVFYKTEKRSITFIVVRQGGRLLVSFIGLN